MNLEAKTMTLDGAVGRTLFSLNEEGQPIMTQTRWSHEPSSGTAAITLTLRSEQGPVEAATLTNSIVVDMESNMGLEKFVKLSIESESIRSAIVELAKIMRGRIDSQDWDDRYSDIVHSPDSEEEGGEGQPAGEASADRHVAQGLVLSFMVFSREDDGEALEFFGPFSSAQEAEDFANEFFNADGDFWTAAEMLTPIGWRGMDRDDFTFPMLLSMLKEIDLTDDQISKLARLSQSSNQDLVAIMERATQIHKRNWQAILGKSRKNRPENDSTA